MIKGLGIDALDIARMQKTLQKQGFLERFFTPEECGYIKRQRAQSAQSAAGIFAAKEAVSKALGTGIRGFDLKDIEIRHNAQGAPQCTLHGGAHKILTALQAQAIYVNITHTDTMAMAVCVIE